jgi:2-methylaconitate cis-trans-isomerase PrpF
MLPVFRTATRNRCLSSSATQLRATPNPLPATFIRGGTSKGVFISRQHLPHDRAEWAPILLSLMGSPDPDYGRQMNGLGGGVSSLSKVMVVGPPSSSTLNVDVEYTFVQVGIRDSVVDYTGNCGNLSSMVGPFALYAGLAAPSPLDINGNSQTTIRALNTNTNKIVH